MAETATTETFQHQEVIDAALTEILGSTCGIEIAADPEGGAAMEASRNQAALIAIISLVGDVEWSLCLGLPKATAEKIGEKFFGMPLEFDGPDLSDCVGEIANIFAGDVKGKLDERGVKADISLPSVIRGIAIRILVGRGSPYTCNYYTSEAGKFWCEVVTGKDAVPTAKPGE